MSFSNIMGLISVTMEKLDAGVREINMFFQLLQWALSRAASAVSSDTPSSGNWSLYFQNQKLRSSYPDLEKPPPAQGAQQEGYNPWSADGTAGSTTPEITGVQRWDSGCKLIFVSLLKMLVGRGNAENRWTLMPQWLWQCSLGRNVFLSFRTSRACTQKQTSHGMKRKASSGKLLSLIYSADKKKFLTQK